MLIWVSGSRRPSGGTASPVIGNASPGTRVPSERDGAVFDVGLDLGRAGAFGAARSPSSLGDHLIDIAFGGEPSSAVSTFWERS